VKNIVDNWGNRVVTAHRFALHDLVVLVDTIWVDNAGEFCRLIGVVADEVLYRSKGVTYVDNCDSFQESHNLVVSEEAYATHNFLG